MIGKSTLHRATGFHGDILFYNVSKCFFPFICSFIIETVSPILFCI